MGVETKPWRGVTSQPRSFRESGAGLQAGLGPTAPRKRSHSQALLLDSRSSCASAGANSGPGAGPGCLSCHWHKSHGGSLSLPAPSAVTLSGGRTRPTPSFGHSGSDTREPSVQIPALPHPDYRTSPTLCFPICKMGSLGQSLSKPQLALMLWVLDKVTYHEFWFWLCSNSSCHFGQVTTPL